MEPFVQPHRLRRFILSGKYITMIYVTDDSINTGGWQAKYEQREARVACGGLVGGNGHGYRMNIQRIILKINSANGK